MADEGKIRVERFNSANFEFWKMQSKTTCIRKIYIFLWWKGLKAEDVRRRVRYSRSESPKGDPIIPGIDDCIQHLLGEDNLILDGGPLKYVRELSTSNNVFLMKKLFKKMADNRSGAEHLNEFSTLARQLESVEINFDDEIRVLVLLSSLPEV